MKKYLIIISCLLFIAGITSCATKQDEDSAQVKPLPVYEANIGNQ